MTQVEHQQQQQQQHRRGGSDADEVVEYLQLAGRRYQEHVELLREEQALREAQHAPFKPTISAYADHIGKTSVVRQGSSIGSRLHELHQKRLALLAEEAAAEAQRQEVADRSACSFAPVVTSRAERSARSDAEVSSALQQWEEHRRARQARRQVEATRTELSNVTGVPRISAYAAEKAAVESASRRAVPIEVSLLADAAARRQRQHNAFEQRHGSPSGAVATSATFAAAPFSPAISAYASSIRYQQGVVDRLYTHHHQHRSSSDKEHPPSQQKNYDEEATLHCTFRPRLSPQSTELSRRYYAEEGEDAVEPHDRLHRNTHHPSKYRKSVLPEEATGVPEISAASRHIVEERRRRLALEGDPGALGNSPGTRLYPRARSATSSPPRPTFKKKVVTARDVELQTALTFAPAVSAQSEAMWRQRVTALKASGVARGEGEARQLLWRKAEKKREEDVAKAQAQRRRDEASACTFHPVAGRPPHRRSGYLAMSIEDRTQRWATQRDARLSELRREVDGSVLDECSFHPRVDAVFPLPRPEAQPATGVEAFVERHAEARRQREEDKEWWKPQYARTLTPRTTLSKNNKGVPQRHHQQRSSSGVQRASSVDASSLSLTSSSQQRQRRGVGGQHGVHRSVSAHAAAVGSPLRRTVTAATATTHCSAEEEEEVFEQHWAARQPPSTSLTASSFSRVSQPDVPSAESSPRQQQQQRQQQSAYVVRQSAAEGSSTSLMADTSTGPYRWRPSSASAAASATPAWRKPLRYSTH